MKFINIQVKKICGINIIKKILIIKNKRRSTVENEDINNLALENNYESNKFFKKKKDLNFLNQYKNLFGGKIRNHAENNSLISFYKLKELNNLFFFGNEIDFENIQLSYLIWKIICKKCFEKNNIFELVDILIKKNGRRKFQEKLKYIEKSLQIENKCNLIINIIFKDLFKIYKFNKKNNGNQIFENLDLTIMNHPFIRNHEDFKECLNNIITEFMNLDNNEFDIFTHKIAKISMISENMFKLWSKELNSNLNVRKIIDSNFENSQNYFINLILIYGYLIWNKLENKEIKDEDILLIILNKITKLLEEINDSVHSNQLKLLIELVLLNLTEESNNTFELKLSLLKLINKIIENNNNSLLITLIISKILKNYDIWKSLNNESLLTEEFISIINKYIIQKKQIKDNNLLNTSSSLIMNKLDIENLELILKKPFINSKMTKNIIEIILNKIQSQILSNIDTWKEYNFDFNQINFDLLNELIQSQNDKNFNTNHLENNIILHFIKTLKIFMEKITIHQENKLFKLNFEPSKVNILKLISIINLKFDELNQKKYENYNLIKIINCYDFNKIIQNILKENLSKDSCNWEIINEGTKFLNNYLLTSFNAKLLNNFDEIFEFSKLIMNQLKKRFINDETNQLELNYSIPQSNIYFEILRLIHNTYYISNSKLKENYDNNSIKLLHKGIIPFHLNDKEYNADFLFNKISEYIYNTNNEKNSINYSNSKNINLIFIHGFLGSAFKSWNIDFSKESKIPIIVDDNFQIFNIIKNMKNYFNFNFETKINNNNIISKLEKHNYLIWPRILLTNNKGIRMFAVDYSHEIFNQNQSITLKEISEEIYKKLLKANIFSKDTRNDQEKNNIIICHSMGGILLKQIISNHPETIKSIKGIIFFGTPHFGTNLHSNVIKIFKKKVSPYIIELSSKFNIKQLRKLNLKFQKLIYSIPKQERPPIYSFSEYLPCKIPFLFNISKIIVPHINSNPFIGNFFILKTDHNFINKLTIYKNDIRYLLIQNMIDL